MCGHGTLAPQDRWPLTRPAQTACSRCGARTLEIVGASRTPSLPATGYAAEASSGKVTCPGPWQGATEQQDSWGPLAGAQHPPCHPS